MDTGIVLSILGILATIAAGTGIAALVRVFVVERKSVNQDEITDLRAENRQLRADLNAEIAARRADRQWYEGELRKCLDECRSLRVRVENA